MKQKYILIIEGKRLPKDMSKDIACELDCGFVLDNGSKIKMISVQKDEREIWTFYYNDFIGYCFLVYY